MAAAFMHADQWAFVGRISMQTWTGWKRFTDAQGAEFVDAPAGPGVYEVRHTLTGRVVAFGHARNVSAALDELRRNGGVGTFARLFRRQLPASRVSDLEYRVCAASTRSEAKTTAQRLLGLRQTAWRRRMDYGWSVRA